MLRLITATCLIASPAFAQMHPGFRQLDDGSELDAAVAICNQHIGQNRPVPGWEEGFENCSKVIDEWSKTIVAKQQAEEAARFAQHKGIIQSFGAK